MIRPPMGYGGHTDGTKGNKMLEMIKSLLGKGEKKEAGGCCGGHAQKAEEIKKAGGGSGGRSEYGGHERTALIRGHDPRIDEAGCV